MWNNPAITANGDVRWHAWTSRAIFDGDGSIKEIQAVGRDTTEMKRAADAIRLSEEKFSNAFRAGPDSILITRISDGVIIDSNDRFLIRTGRTWEDTVGRPLSDILTWEDPKDREKLISALRATGECTDLETKFRYTNGNLINCLVSARTIEVDGEKCAITITRDITEQKRAADAIRLSEEKFSKAFRAGPDSIVITRQSDGLIIDSNDRFLTKTGRTWADTVGRPITEVLAWESPEDRQIMMERLRESGECSDFETDFRFASGELLNCIVSARTIEVDGENCVLTITRDVTEQKRAADAIRLSEEKFSKAFRAGPERSVITRVSDGTIIDLNDRFLARIGKKTRRRHRAARFGSGYLGTATRPGNARRGYQEDGRVHGPRSGFPIRRWNPCQLPGLGAGHRDRGRALHSYCDPRYHRPKEGGRGVAERAKPGSGMPSKALTTASFTTTPKCA